MLTRREETCCGRGNTSLFVCMRFRPWPSTCTSKLRRRVHESWQILQPLHNLCKEMKLDFVVEQTGKFFGEAHNQIRVRTLHFEVLQHRQVLGHNRPKDREGAFPEARTFCCNMKLCKWYFAHELKFLSRTKYDIGVISCVFQKTTTSFQANLQPRVFRNGPYIFGQKYH